MLARLVGLIVLPWLALLLAAAAPASAQQPLPGLSLPGAARAPAATPPASGKAELDALIRTLEDEQARARLVARLKDAAAAPPPAASAQPPLAPALGQLQVAAAERVAATAEAVVGLLASVRAVPELAGWLGAQLRDEVTRAVWWSVLSQAGLAGVLGYAAARLVRFLLRGWRARHTGPPSVPSTAAKLAVAGARLLVDLLALAAFLAVAAAVLRWLEPGLLVRVVAGDILAGVAVGRTLTALSRAVLSPGQAAARLPPLTDRQAGAARRWIGLLTGFAVYGYAGLEAARRLGLPWAAHGLLVHLLFLVVTALVVVAIFRVRAYVAALIRGLDRGRGGWVGRLVPQEFLAEAGPWLLAGWVVLEYLVWALRIPGGTLVLTRGGIVTVLALAALRVLYVLLDRKVLAPPREAGLAQAAADGAAEDGEPEPPPPSAGRRLATAALRIVGGIVAGAVILWAWGVDVAGWLDSRAGQEVVGRTAQLALVAVLAGLLWYAVDRAAARYITAEDAEGNLVHDNRTRTLANIIRNLALTAAVFMVGGHLLAAVGVNPTALLAGAGVVGFAIGFGSQKLVQDLTTGLFILLGDTIRVGDVVRLGDRSGVVEAVSMRTVTLRDYNGDVHTIPYSSISIVTNMTKDYSFAVFNVAVGYGEDVDRITEVLREVDSGLRREWPYRRLMLEPLDLAGLDAFTDKGVVVVARSKTRAGEQWKVGREFNRRLKQRFDELGIDFPYPHQTVHVTDPAPTAAGRGGVVPLHLQPRPAEAAPRGAA